MARRKKEPQLVLASAEPTRPDQVIPMKAKSLAGDRAAFRKAMGGASLPRGDEDTSPANTARREDARREAAPPEGSNGAFADDDGPIYSKPEQDEPNDGDDDDRRKEAGERADEDDPLQGDDPDETPADDDDDEPATGDDADTEEDYDRACDGLHRSGFTWKEIRAMGRQQAIRRGLRAATRFEADDEAHDFVRRSRRTKNAEGEGDAGAGDTPKGEDAAPVKFTDLLKPFAEKAQIDEEAVATLAAALQQPFDRQQALIANLAQNENQRQQDEEGRLIVSARKELRERIPGLASESRFRDVLDQMQVMARGKKYRTIKQSEGMEAAVLSMMEDAAVASGLRKDARREDELARRNDRKAGREDRVHSRSTPPVTRGRPKMRPIDRDRAVFKHVIAHPGDIRGARRAAGLE